MRTLFTFILLAVSQLSFSQQKNEVGFFIAPVRQSAIAFSAGTADDYFKPVLSTSLETGVFFTRNIAKKIDLQANLNFGIVYQTMKSDIQNRNPVYNNNEVMYWFSFIPKIEYSLLRNSKKLQLIGGVGVRHFFDVVAGGTSSFGYNGINAHILETSDFSTGTYTNPIANEKKWQWFGDIGIAYNANLYKNRIFIKINPFYQPAFSDAYTGVYKYTNASIVETGTYKGRLNQSGVRLLFAYKF